jgi:hypothetical protein
MPGPTTGDQPHLALHRRVAPEDDALSTLRDYLLPRLLSGALTPVPDNRF